MASKTDLNQSRPRCNDGRIHIAMLKKKSDAKSFNKAINKHGLDALHLARELAAATATYLGAAERTQLKNGQDYYRRQRNPESDVIEHFVLETQP
jgi:hypothetical protein